MWRQDHHAALYVASKIFAEVDDFHTAICLHNLPPYSIERFYTTLTSSC
jgi:hypothetical protein